MINSCITSLLSPHSFLKCRPPLFSSHSSPFSSHTCQQTRSIRNLKTTLVHAKLGSSGREEGLEEVFFGMDDDIEEESDNEDDEETESSLDLLFRFLQSLFKKVSRKAKKATRSILPPIIAPQLVSFAVDGVLLLSSLSLVKAFLEVVCTVGGTVFTAILLLRLIWATLSHFQSNGNRFNQGGNSYGAPQPVT